MRAGTATCQSKRPRSSSRTLGSAASYRTGDKCKIDIRTQQVHFLGRVDSQLKVRGHRVEIQAVEDILQTQFSEIEAAVLDYQNEELIAFVAAPSVSAGDISVVAPAPAEWAARTTATLAKQLPAPSVPTRIFLVEKFVMKPVSGKIDRGCLPNLSPVLTNANSEADGSMSSSPTGTHDAEAGNAMPQDTDAGVEPDSDEVLEICRAVFETPLGWDDVFADHGGHSIVIARLVLRLQDAGWVVSVRALLSDCDTARKVASQPRHLQEASETPVAAVKPVQNDTEQR